MRFKKFYMTEKIVVPPRIGLTMSKEMPFFKNRHKEIKNIIKTADTLLKKMKPFLSSSSDDDFFKENTGSYSLSLANGLSLDAEEIENLLKMLSANSSSYYREIYHIDFDLELFLGELGNVSHINRIVRSINEFQKNWRYEYFTSTDIIKKELENRINRYGYKKGLDDNFEEYNVGSGFNKFAKLLKEFFNFLSTIPKILEYLKSKSEALSHSWQKREAEPLGKEDVETLYHASWEAKKLLKTGFKNKFDYNNDRMQGLGGSVNINNTGKNGISFTYDLYIAKEIARYFKEIAYIATGKMKIDKLLDMIKRDGMIKDVLSYWEREKLGGEFTGGRVKKLKPHRDFMDLIQKYKDGDMHEFKSLKPEDLVNLFYVYRSLHPKLYNPVPWGFDAKKVVQHFKKNKASDIGVLVADVRLDKNTSFVSAEREFRVTPDNIIKLKKVI